MDEVSSQEASVRCEVRNTFLHFDADDASDHMSEGSGPGSAKRSRTHSPPRRGSAPRAVKHFVLPPRSPPSSGMRYNSSMPQICEDNLRAAGLTSAEIGNTMPRNAMSNPELVAMGREGGMADDLSDDGLSGLSPHSEEVEFEMHVECEVAEGSSKDESRKHGASQFHGLSPSLSPLAEPVSPKNPVLPDSLMLPGNLPDARAGLPMPGMPMVGSAGSLNSMAVGHPGSHAPSDFSPHGSELGHPSPQLPGVASMGPLGMQMIRPAYVPAMGSYPPGTVVTPGYFVWQQDAGSPGLPPQPLQQQHPQPPSQAVQPKQPARQRHNRQRSQDGSVASGGRSSPRVENLAKAPGRPGSPVEREPSPRSQSGKKAVVPPAPGKPQMPSAPRPAPAPETPAPAAAPAPAATAAPAEGADVKDQLLRLIYDMMVAKGFNSPRGHLLMDVYIEVWREVVGPAAATGGKTALERFAVFLSSAPDMFEVFDLNILPTKEVLAEELKDDCRERMVRLIPRA